jgi:GMP synthase (glutamine-hydrolysing)
VIILSGGPRSTSDKDAPDIDFERLMAFGVPVLGVCYGMQLLNIKHGGTVKPGVTREYGPAKLVLSQASPLFEGISHESQVWMSHSDTCSNLGSETAIIATNEDAVPVALQWGPRCFGIQFHPEVTHSHEGSAILRNFLTRTGAKLAPFDIQAFKAQMLEQIQRDVAGREVICGVSGGVDSTVLAVLLQRAGVKLRALYIDTGLMRLNETAEVKAQFEEVGVPVEIIDASEAFLTALQGVEDPEAKRKIIGNLFIDVFWKAAGDEVELLAQGTLYPDVIESATSGSIASKIKTHHNRVDRILALKEQGKVLEPLSELFKDEVRALGASLGIPASALGRHPFPGPGLAVRVPGEVTPEKLAICRAADDIWIKELRRSGQYDRVWQAYAAFLPVKTVGVKGDERSYEAAISLRAVVSEDAMTADWVELPYEVLRSASNKILNSVKGINRVLYDISTKPPASIEWE